MKAQRKTRRKKKKYIGKIWISKPIVFNPTILPAINKDTYKGAIGFKNIKVFT